MRHIVELIKTRRAAVLMATAIAVFYFVFDPLEWRFMPQCVFHRVTGLQCAGCGSQRMLHALLHGDVAGAFRANAFAVLSLPIIAFLLWLETQRTKRPGLYGRVYKPLLIYAAGAIVVVWTVVRNLLGI